MNDPTLPREIDEESTRTMRTAFMSDAGRDALAWMLVDTGFFDIIEGSENLAVRNYMVHLLEQLGILETWNIRDIVDIMIKVKPKRQRKRRNGKRKLKLTSKFRARRFIDGSLRLPWQRDRK